MVNLLALLLYICPFVLIPYLVIMVAVFVYFVYQKYQVRTRIENVPYSTIFNIDLDKVKKNLEIQSMVYDFMLLLMMIEVLANVFWGIRQFIYTDLNKSKFHIVNTSTSVRNQTIFKVTIEVNHFLMLLFELDTITLSLILPVLCLFLIVLRRAFINLPYKLWVRKYSVYILVRVVLMSIMSLFIETHFIVGVMYLLFFLFDICVYISSSHAFYVLLKGRRDEALYHSSRKDYLEKKSIAKQYFYTQIFSLFGLFIILLYYISNFFEIIISMLTNPVLFQSISLGYFPNFSFYTSNAMTIANRFSDIFQPICALLLELCAFLPYIVIFVSILLKLLIRRKKFNHVNDWITRPLMERYRSSLEKRRIQQRPPFIQAFRSGIVY